MHLSPVSIALVGIVIVSAAALVSAGGHDDEGEQDDRHDDVNENRRDDHADARRDAVVDRLERKVSVRSDEDGASFVFKREAGADEDKLEAAFKVDDARFEMKYETENRTAETEMKVRAAFESLVEYRDMDHDGRFSSDDQVVSAFSIGDAKEIDVDGAVDWGRPVVEDVSVDGETGKLVRVPAVFGETGRFELRFYVFGDFVDLGGVDLRPTSIKIDIYIADYPYVADDTALALILETETKHEIEHEDGDRDRDDEDDHEVATVARLDDTEFRLVFSWLDTAEVEGTTHAVHTTLLGLKEEREVDGDGSESKEERRFAFSYARGDEILHDPQVELRTRSITVEESPAVAPVVGVVLLVAAVAFVRRAP